MRTSFLGVSEHLVGEVDIVSDSDGISQLCIYELYMPKLSTIFQQAQ